MSNLSNPYNLPLISTVNSKADKVANATNGHIATLDADGNLVDGGASLADIAAGFSVEVVQTLPTEGVNKTIYLLPLTGGTSPNVYEEYIFINNAWEKIGSTEIDLSNYYEKKAIDLKVGALEMELNSKQAQLTAGQNIEISNNTIKAVGYKYNTTTGAFAEGDRNINDGGSIRTPSVATGVLAHAEGYDSNAIGRASHAEGNGGTATGSQSHAEGRLTFAKGNSSHAEGVGTIAAGIAEHAQGAYNKSHNVTTTFDGNAGNTLHSIGFGTSDSSRKNAVEVMQNGDVYVYGIGGYCGTDIKAQTNGIQTLQEALSSPKPRVVLDDDGGFVNADDVKVQLFAIPNEDGFRVIKADWWCITEVQLHHDDDPIYLRLYDDANSWVDNAEYIIRIVCNEGSGEIELAIDESIRFANQINSFLAEGSGIASDSEANRYPHLREGFTYDIHILNGIAWWIETPNM